MRKTPPPTDRHTAGNTSIDKQEVNPFEETNKEEIIKPAIVVLENQNTKNTDHDDEQTLTLSREHSTTIKNVPPLLPSSEDNRILKENEKTRSCKPDYSGQCNVHDCEMSILNVTARKWGDRGGGRGYGWMRRKVKKYVCRAGPTQPSLSVPTNSDVLSDGASKEAGNNSNSSGDLRHVFPGKDIRVKGKVQR